MRDDLLDAQAAVDWAAAQLPALQARIAAWADAYSTRIAVENGKKAYYLRVNPIPAIINAETGAIINSIRSSLDLLANALAGRNGYPAARDVYFPVRRSLADFLNTKSSGGKNKLKKLSVVDQTAIENLAPYQGGNDLLFALHDLDITRKHRRLIEVRHFPRGVGAHSLDGSIVCVDFNPDWQDFGDTTPIAWTAADAPDCKIELSGIYVAINEPGAVQGQQVIVALPKFVILAHSILALFDK